MLVGVSSFKVDVDFCGRPFSNCGRPFASRININEERKTKAKHEKYSKQGVLTAFWSLNKIDTKLQMTVVDPIKFTGQ